MNRRKFLSRAGFGVISAAAAAQAVAQTPALPEVRWRCASSFPKSLDTIYGGGETIAKRVAAITGGKFQIRVFGAGEIVPAFGTVDAVQQGTVECTHTASYYFQRTRKTQLTQVNSELRSLHSAPPICETDLRFSSSVAVS